MTWPHLHLMLSHLPVLGAPFLLLLLAWALVPRSEELTRLALGATVALAVVTVPVYLTGEPAEEAIETLPGVSEQVVDRHEERAETACTRCLPPGRSPSWPGDSPAGGERRPACSRGWRWSASS